MYERIFRHRRFIRGGFESRAAAVDGGGARRRHGAGAAETLPRPRRVPERRCAAEPRSHSRHHAAGVSPRRAAGTPGGNHQALLFDRDAACRRRRRSAAARNIHCYRRRHEAASGTPKAQELQALDAHRAGVVVDCRCSRRGDVLHLALIFSWRENDESQKPGKNNPALARAFPRERLRVELRRGVERAIRPVALQAARRLRCDRGRERRLYRAARRRQAALALSRRHERPLAETPAPAPPRPALPAAGRPMKTAHAGLGITESDWQLTVKHLVASLDKFKVPEKEKQEFLALASSLKPDIVEK